VHRNSTNNGLTVTSGIETTTSYKDTYSFSYGMGPLSLMVRYDTRIRVHASYGCTIKVNTRAATVTGGGFFHGGVTIEPQLDCQIGSYIDIIPEDGSLLMAGKKRMVWDPICGSGTIPLCTSASPPPLDPDPPSPPATPPSKPSPPATPPDPPSPPPFPPSPSLPLPTLSGEGIGLLVGVGGASAILFGCLSWFVFCFKKNTYNKTAYASLLTDTNNDKQPRGQAAVAGVPANQGRRGVGSETGMTTDDANVVYSGGIWLSQTKMYLGNPP